MHQDWKDCKTTEDLSSKLKNNVVLLNDGLNDGLAQDIWDVVQRAFELGLESNRTYKPKCVKFVSDGLVYYFSDPNHLKTAQQWGSRARQHSLSLMLHASFVVDIRQNELKKCRFPIEDVIDAACM